MDLNVSEAQPQQQQNQATLNDQQQQQANQNQQQQQNQQPPYTIPGILHYLQYEWHRFEVERQEWEVERAELSARIALLQGERKSHENLKHDLIRRIKMLEYCLRMERAKYYKLKHGTDPPPLESGLAQQSDEDNNSKDRNESDGGTNATSSNINNSSTVTYGRELLRHYLQEIGYTDTIIDLRSNRVRSLLGIVDNNNQASNQHQQQQPNEGQSISNATSDEQKPIVPTTAAATTTATVQATSNSAGVEAKKKDNKNPSDNNYLDLKRPLSNSNALTNDTNASSLQNQPGQVGDAEASVLATFGFLYDNAKDSNQLDEDVENLISEDMVDAADRAASTRESEYSYFYSDKECNDAVMIRQKLDLLNNVNGKAQHNTASTNATVKPSSIDVSLDNRKTISEQTQQQSPTIVATSNAKQQQPNWCPNSQKSEVVDIGELATLTTLGSDSNSHDYRKKQWSAKFRLQSHYDCVRALCFSETDSLLVTASEDETIKLWHLMRPSSNNSGGKSRQPNLPINAIGGLEGPTDIEPFHTYRGHTSRILSITIFRNNIFSGAQNGELIMWKMITETSTADQYDVFDSSLLVCRFTGHDDAVWSVETVEQPKSETLLCSASADLTIKIWNTDGINTEPLCIVKLESSPTCIAKMPFYNVCHAEADIAVSSCDGKIRLYDIATCLKDAESNTHTNTQPKATLMCDDKSYRINSIVIHPTLPYLASADSNHDIKFWDLKTRKCKSTMVAHLDEVTSLACDPSGKYLLSASHDCSVRLWLFEEKACIQEITSHRKKFDEGIFAVAFHPNLSHFATAGADGLAKVFV